MTKLKITNPTIFEKPKKYQLKDRKILICRK